VKKPVRHIFFIIAVGIIGSLVIVSSGASEAVWKSVGPGGGGWLVDIEYSPSRNELFAALDCGGVRITNNGGTTWEAPSAGLGSYYASEVEDVAIHPQNAKVVFLTAWTGIYRSNDAGRTWKSVLTVGNGSHLRVNTIAFDPDNARVMYAASGTTKNSLGFVNVEGNTDAQGIVWRSLDEGITWHELFSFDQRMSIYSIMVDGRRTRTHEDNHLVLSTNKGLWKTENGGKSFTKITNGIPENLRQAVQSHLDRNLLWAAAMYDGVYRSRDFGSSWERIGPLEKRAYVYLTVDPARSGNYVNTIAVSYHDYHDHGGVLIANGAASAVSWKQIFPNEKIGDAWNTSEGSVAGAVKIGYPKGTRTLYLIVPGARLYQSVDNGASWTALHTKKIGNDWRGEGFELMILADGAIDPRNGIIYASYIDMGTFRSADQGLTWKQLFAGGHFAGGNPETVAVNPRTGEVFVSVESGTTLSSINYGLSFSKTLDAKAYHIAFDRDGVAYAATNGGVFVRTGKQWSPIGDIRSVRAIAIVSDSLFAGNEQGIWQWKSGQWKLLFSLSGIIPGGLSAPPSGDRLLVATNMSIYQWDGKLLTPRYTAHDLQSMKNVGTIVYVKSRSKGLWRSTDFGTTWADVTGGVYQDGYERGLIIDPKNSNIVYYGAKCMGVFKADVSRR